jgi:hypothetical protein
MSGTFVPLPRDINELKVKPVEKLNMYFLRLFT